MKKRTLALGLVIAMASSVALFTGCSQTATSVAADPSSSASATAAVSDSSAEESTPTLAATATATLGETSSGPITVSEPTTSTSATSTNRSSSPTQSMSSSSTDAESNSASTGSAATTSSTGSSQSQYAIEDKGDYAVVKLGSESAAVTALQETLTDLGYLNGATGYFGTDTETALEAFQEANHLTVDGVAGNSTWDVILAGNAVEA